MEYCQAQTRYDLTRREAQVLELTIAGWSGPAIAQELYISLKTVDAHKEHIRTRLEGTGQGHGWMIKLCTQIAYESGLGEGIVEGFMLGLEAGRREARA